MPTALEELTSISLILSATNHRNKNQHRLAKWWKAFSVLRRNILKLVSELGILSANEKRLGEKKKTIASREVVERRADFLVEWIVPKCYMAFSALVADNQYANLGLMLTGTLARIRKIVQPLRKEVEVEQDDVEVKVDVPLEGDAILDLGEVIMREEAQITSPVTVQGGEDAGASAESKKNKKMKRLAVEELGEDTTVESAPSKPREKRKKKKRKGHDDFDDLFARLL